MTIVRLLSVVLAASLLAIPVAAQDDDQCLACHGAQSELADFVDDPARLEALHVDGALFGRSVHSTLSCSDCHDGFEDVPHETGTMTIGCTECHDDSAAALAASVHGRVPDAASARVSPSCVSCHGTHDILPASERESRLFPLNVHVTCGQCHFEHDPLTSTVDELLDEPYTDDSHARAILRSGLTVSATCISCHGGHDIHASGDPASPVARANVDQTCGACHVGVLEEYRRSVHHLAREGDELRGATCTDCHRPHDINQADDDFRMQTVAACSECHAERAGSFRLSYHGKASSLGFQGTMATCSSCHGAHDILPESDPLSMVHLDNRVNTCAQCHEGAHAEFANFAVHADPRDKENHYGLHIVWVTMNGLLVGVLILGCLHALLWLVRSLAAGDYKRPRPTEPVRYVRRWRKSFIVFHLWMMLSVLLLACTGLPLHFADKGWALTLMGLFGGPLAAGLVHRFAAIALVVLFACFFVHILWRLVVKREKPMFKGPDSMMPRVKDVQDVWATVRWFLFLAPRPRYDRWTYWEKFDFWAATWGLFVIGVSGLMLWFPVQATHVLPAWFLNAAVIIHGIEALLDIAFIFTVHVFHANLRPDKFPIDTMFLTGRITEAEFRHERPLEWERLSASGQLASIAADPPSRALRTTAYVLGAACLALGFFFVVMMLVAVVQAW